MRVTVKAINDELAKRGGHARLEKGNGYFYFSGGEAEGWLDRTVHAENLSSLSLDQWMAEFERLKKVNGEMLGEPAKKESAPKRRQGKR